LARCVEETVRLPRTFSLSSVGQDGDGMGRPTLLEKQKAGKKRMKQIGSVEVPQEAFLSVLKVAE